MRVLILYTELAGYVLGNINRFLNTYPEARLFLVHYPVNAEAPFKIEVLPGSEFVEWNKDNTASLEKQILDFNPGIVLCSGWSNRLYMRVIKKLSGRVKKVLCFDNQWKGSLKQRILILFSGIFLLNRFQYAWVPGIPQRNYAIRLGFKPSHVFTGLYPADTAFFSSLGLKKLALNGSYPKSMLSVARYIPQKDLPTLWKAFISANQKTGNRWVLNCFGLGELFDQRIQARGIIHHGFIQPSEMENFILESGVYILPSIQEPWGVAVHEMALSALPLVLSDSVGAASMFLKENNGFTFPAGNAEALEAVLIQVMNMSDEELRTLSQNSFISGKQLLSEDWSKILLQIYNS